MCGEVVAAPLSLQDTVYPILRKKSLHFCEKSKKFLKLCTAVRKKYKTKRLRRRTNSLRQNLSVLPARWPSASVWGCACRCRKRSKTLSVTPDGVTERVAVPLGKVAANVVSRRKG